ncbi:nuclear pore complex protein Nup214 isoform X3 [Lepisosteus oculatus]|uniref:nuclear pore complex protein Nup214 isoform X3 n=1 Tax=Lepisosteus oculatus TaxID=7918 RepID=UPI0037113E8F
MSDDLDAIPEREMKDFQFRQMKKIRIFDTPEELPKERSNLLAVSNKYGLTFIGYDTELKVFQTCDIVAANRIEGNPNEIVEGVNGTSVALESPVHHVALSCDELTLSVCTLSAEGGGKLSFFDVRTLLNKARPEKLPFTSLRPAVQPGTSVKDLKWNPALPSLLAACLSDGSMLVLEVLDSAKLQAQLPPTEGITCVCWSPKGKQVAAGKKNATVTQYSPTLQEKKVIPCPHFYSSDNQAKVLDVLWLSTYVFAVVYTAADDALETPPDLVVVSLPKKDEKREERYLNFNDIVYGSCTERQHHYFLSHVEDWDIVLAASAASIEVSIIAKQDDKTSWELWLLEDASRAELPVTMNNDDTLPLGVAIDYTSQEEIPISEEKTLPPAPILMLLSTDGVLCPFYLINQNPGVKQLCTVPVSLPVEGERQPSASAGSPPPYSAGIPAGPPALRPPASTPAPTSVLFAPAGPPAAAPGPGGGLGSGFSFASAAQLPTAPSAFSLGSPASCRPGPAAPSSGAAGFSFTAAAPRPLSSAPSASAFSFSAPAAKPAGERPSGPPVGSSPLGGFRSVPEPATPAVKTNLSERFSAVDTPAPAAGGPQQFFTPAPKASFPGPVNQSTPLPGSSKAAASSVPARQAQTFTPTPVVQKPSSSAQAPVRTATPQTPVSVKTQLEKQLQQRKDSDPIMTGILEEIAHFQKELDDLKARTEKADFSVGNPGQMKELRNESEDLHTFILEIKETTESLHGDISTLKTSMLEGFAGVEEARSQNELNKDREYLQLLYKKPLDPRSEEQLKEIRRLYQYIKFAVEDVNGVLDLEWEKQLEKKKKQKHLVVPEREALFNALANNLGIINQQKQKLGLLVKSLQDLRLYSKTSQRSVSGQTSPQPTVQGLDNELESLRRALLKASLETSPKAPSKSPAKMSPVKQSQLRNFLSKRNTPPVRSTAPANLSRSAFLSPKYFEDLDDVSSTSSQSQALEPEDPQAEELEESPLSVPRHPAVVRTPSIQPGFTAQSTPFSKVHAGLGPGPVPGPASILSPVPTPKISAGGADSTALATKTVKHGAPPADRGLAVLVPAQQAAAAAALRRQMASQKPAVSTSLTESTLKNVPQVVNVQELKDKGPAPPVSTVISSSVPAPAAQVVQQVLATVATNQAKRTQNSSQNTLKAAGPTTGSLTSLQSGFVFGGSVKNETPAALPASSSVPILGEQTSKTFSFSSAASGGGFGFSSLNASSAATTQGSGNSQGKDASQLSKFSFGTGTAKMVFGSGGEGAFSFAPKPAPSAAARSTPTAGVGGEPLLGSKPAPPTAGSKPEAQPSKSGNGLFQPTVGGETLGSFSGLRVGQGDEEAKEAPKGGSAGFSFAQVEAEPPAGNVADFSFGSTFQMGKPADSASKEAVSSAAADTPEAVGAVFGNVQAAGLLPSSGVFKPAEPAGPGPAKPALSFSQPSGTSAAPPAAVTSFSSLLVSSPAAPAHGSSGEAARPSAAGTEPPAAAEPVKPVAPQGADREGSVSLPAKPAPVDGGVPSSAPALPADETRVVTAPEKLPAAPKEPAALSAAPPPAAPAASPTPVSTAPGAPPSEGAPASSASPAAQSSPSPAPLPQQPSLFGQPPSSDRPGSIFTQTPVSTQGTTLGVSSLSQAVTTVASPAAPTPTSTPAATAVTASIFGQPPAATTSAPPAPSGFGSSGFDAGFGKPVFGQTAGFGQPASGSASTFSFGQAAFGSSPAFGQPAASAPASSSGGIFGSASTSSANSFSFGQLAVSSASSTGGSLFGQSGAPAFGQSSTFGQSSAVFGSNTTTTSSTGFGFGQSSGFGNAPSTSVFGQPPSGSSVFGQQQSSTGGGLFGSGNNSSSVAGGGAGGGGGFFSGLGGKPSEDAANKNPFGSTSSGAFGQASQAGTSSLFGNSGAKTFGFGSSSFGEQKPSGTFSTGGGTVAAQGFGSFSTPAKTGGFGGTPVFGSPPSFGGSPAFGGAPAFGSAPAFSSPLGSTGGKVFGEGTAAASVGGFGFASASNAPSFSSLAGPSSFGSLAQQGSGFGAQSSGFSGFGSSGGAFTGSGFGSTNQSSSQTFGSWRS